MKGEGRREKGKRRREKGEGRREKGEGRREEGEEGGEEEGRGDDELRREWMGYTARTLARSHVTKKTWRGHFHHCLNTSV